MVIRQPIHDISCSALKQVYQHKGTGSPWLAGPRTPNRTSSISRIIEVNRNTSDEKGEGEDYDEEESVADTETSETNSLASLTSVD